MASQEPTQSSTQQMLDPRRLGIHNSGLAEEDATDIIMMLHANSSTAYRIVETMALQRPEHVYYNGDDSFGSVATSNIEEQETIIIGDRGQREGRTAVPLGLALRLSSLPVLKSKHSGFVFGRNSAISDVLFLPDSGKRISNQHFRIYFNENGMLMIADTSTNGTLVDTHLLKSKDPKYNRARMIVNGTMIVISNSNEEETIAFTVQIPNRGVHAARYEEKKQVFISECALGEDKERALQRLARRPYRPTMRWDGGELYNIIGELGKGAFATVHQLATKMDGKILAAKELEKRRFMKNGKIDKKLQDEIMIMQSLCHPNIIKFVEWHDQGDFLYIIMEYAPHGDLQHYLNQHGPIKEDMARPLAQQMLSALHYLHRSRITHRDIKPDNILIASFEPLQVKISDFGLSKMVSHEETFLKTFCGTLLYCAPEVFPDFQNQGTKRRRGAAQRKDYSSAVDIWSLGGVLWYALCKSPPFKGVADATGEGMYKNIMATKLDPTPLLERNVSQDCIDLLTTMLQTDPSARPSELECLNHPWLKNGADMPADPSLQSIVEEDEFEDEAEQQLSQLSLNRDVPESDDEEDYLSDEFEMIMDSRQSKRVRTDRLFPRNQMRDYEDNSSADASFASIEGQALGVDDSLKLMPGHGQRLFGEIGKSAFQSSGVLNVHAHQALGNEESNDTRPVEGAPASTRNVQKRLAPAVRAIPQLDGEAPSASLLGTESMVRDMNMASPHSPVSGSDEPPTPKTPDVHQHNSLEYPSKASENSEPTPRPKAPTLNRQISLPKTASLFWDPYNRETHTLEYASKVSGFDFVRAQQSGITAGASEMANTVTQSPTQSITQSTDNESLNSDGVQPSDFMAIPQLPAELDFKPPLRRLGKLAATHDSFAPTLVLNLDKSKTSWGRLRSNTIVYENGHDTRIPKVAFVIFWWSSQADLRGEDIEKLSQQGKDWTALDDLHVGIFTCATSGITVNGKHLMQKDRKGREVFIELHTGDIIQVYHTSKNTDCLKFKCDFYVGEGKEPRGPYNPLAIHHSSRLPPA